MLCVSPSEAQLVPLRLGMQHLDPAYIMTWI